MDNQGKYYGKYSGQVTEIKLNDNKKLGWIMVKVPAVFADLAVKARPCFPPCHFFVPPIGANVWVEFEAGDPSFPIWTGMWYAQGAVPQEADINPPEDRVMQTPSGHTVEFMDKSGSEKVVIRHKDNSYVALDKDGGVLITNKNGSHVFLNAKDTEVTVVEEHGNVLRMKSDGISFVNSAGTVLEMKDGKVKVIAKDAVTLMAKDVNIESSGVNLGQGASTSPGGPGTPAEKALLAETFLMAFATHTHPTALGPSGPPIPVPPLVPPFTLALSKSVKVKS